MKSPIKQIASFSLALLYVFVALPASSAALRAEQPPLGDTGHTRGMQFSVVSGDWLYSLPQSSTFTLPARQSDAPASTKLLLHGLSAVEQSEALAGAVLLACYLRQTAGFPVHLRKSDLIFPFHYFW
ncbi:MAG: hypothetical protein IAE84_16840 [Saprospiraceae bacterium]|nr:hypothetical protein [Saprospiraceae bacterium]HRD81283.1 hypothetical protein [Saprospiraceae bacterium]HRF39308.1 hypothetical protein [Saprospiraceae bacterium]HRK83582.1 hypothetical protein [Saprospiraceae bacterium]